MDMCFLSKYPGAWIAISHGKSMFNFVRNQYFYFYNYVWKWLCHFAFLSVLHESSSCSTSLPVFGVASVLDFGLSNRCWVSHCFNLHFSDDIWCRASFHMLTAICISSLVRHLLRSYTHFLIMLFIFLLLSFEGSVYILYNGPVAEVCLANTFSICLIFLFPWYCLLQNRVLNFNEVHLSIISLMDCVFGIVTKVV